MRILIINCFRESKALFLVKKYLNKNILKQIFVTEALIVLETPSGPVVAQNTTVTVTCQVTVEEMNLLKTQPDTGSNR